MVLSIVNRHSRSRISRSYLEKKIRRILRHLNLHRSILDITFVTDRQISRLNRRYLGKKGPTDVLSFPMEDEAPRAYARGFSSRVPRLEKSAVASTLLRQGFGGSASAHSFRDLRLWFSAKADKLLLGDIVVSLDTARRQAIRAGKSLRDEIIFLIIHGLLHLIGYDHVKEKDWRRMKRKEEELVRLVAGHPPNSRRTP